MKLFANVMQVSLWQKEEVKVELLNFLLDTLTTGLCLFLWDVTQNMLQ